MKTETFTTSAGRRGFLFGDPIDTLDPYERVFIAPREHRKDGEGKGTEFDPLRLDWIDGRLQERKNYLIAPGQYRTKGVWANPWQNTWSTLPYGNLIRIGHGKVHIDIDEPVFRDGVEWTYAFFTGFETDGFDRGFKQKIQGIEFGSFDSITFGGLYAWHDADISECDASAIGNSDKALETFCFGSKLRDYGCQMWSRLECFPENYASGISTGTVSRIGGRVTVSDCHVYGNQAHAGIIPGFNTTFRNIISEGTNYGIFHDTEGLEGVRISDSAFMSYYAAIALVRQKEHWHQQGVRVTGCDFTIFPKDNAEAIFLALLTNGDGVKAEESSWRGVRISDCTFDAAHLTPHVLSSHGGKYQPVFSGCDMPDGCKVHGPTKPIIK